MVKRRSKYLRSSKRSNQKKVPKRSYRSIKPRKSKKSKRKSKSPSYKNNCKSKLKNKIRKNVNEMKSGNKRIKSLKQAIAISYSQIRKKYPRCSKILTKK